MNEKIECLRLAMDYAKYYDEHNDRVYKTEHGIVTIAKIFYEFVKDK